MAVLMVEGKEQWQNHEPTAFKAWSRCDIPHVQSPPVARASNMAKPEVHEMRSMIDHLFWSEHLIKGIITPLIADFCGAPLNLLSCRSQIQSNTL